MDIEAVTFKGWMIETFSRDELDDISTYGAQNGYRGLTYYRDTEELYKTYESDIWGLLADDADNFGSKNLLELISTFNGAKNVDSLSQLTNLLVWYAAEKIAREVIENHEYAEEE